MVLHLQFSGRIASEEIAPIACCEKGGGKATEQQRNNIKCSGHSHRIWDNGKGRT